MILKTQTGASNDDMAQPSELRGDARSSLRYNVAIPPDSVNAPSARLVGLVRFLYSGLKIKRGLGRLMMCLARKYESFQSLPVHTCDGRVLYLDLREPSAMPYLLTGRWESVESAFVRAVVWPNDVAIDIGANVGWYSTLLAEAVGLGGRVYSFEPTTECIRMLRASARLYPQLTVTQLALSDHEGEGEMHSPRDLALASLREMSIQTRGERCRLSTLDNCLQQVGSPAPTFVKCDVEGAELEVLRGASTVLGGDKPAMWMVEINPLTCQRFGHDPQSLVEFFLRLPDKRYNAYRLGPERGDVLPLPKPIDSFINAIFVPDWLEHRVVAYRGHLRLRCGDPPRISQEQYNLLNVGQDS
jgi:FkbM family methyltransferase